MDVFFFLWVCRFACLMLNDIADRARKRQGNFPRVGKKKKI